MSIKTIFILFGFLASFAFLNTKTKNTNKAKVTTSESEMEAVWYPSE